MASITLSAAELLLHRLQALDVAYIFINSGTDYPPVIEAWAKAWRPAKGTRAGDLPA